MDRSKLFKIFGAVIAVFVVILIVSMGYGCRQGTDEPYYEEPADDDAGVDGVSHRMYAADTDARPLLIV